MTDRAYALESAIHKALADRKAVLDACPANKQWLGDQPCPKCGASSAGPCWENVRADAILIDRVKELVG